MRVRQNGLVITTIEHKDGRNVVGTDQKEEIIDMAGEDTKTASVSVGLGMTINLGNYQSAKVDVHVTLPSDPDKESLEKTYKDAVDFCKDHVKKEAQAIKNKS